MLNHKYIKSIIYFILITGFISSLYMVFFVFKLEDQIGPLWKSAQNIPIEFFIKRRLYAIEAWVIFGILVIFYSMNQKKS